MPPEHRPLWIAGALVGAFALVRRQQHAAATATVLQRNASLTYRPLGASGSAYPDWVRALKGRSGVYVIRELARDGSTEIVYVGESHTNRLYETLTRHFQTWRRWKGYWKGQYAEGHDPGLTYDRARVEVATRITSPSAALDEEARLILRLQPRDNLRGQPEDEVPF
jgi:hypothetical protein